MLFQWDLRRTPPEEVVQHLYSALLPDEDHPEPQEKDAFAESLFRGVIGDLEAVDGQIAQHAQHWRIDRMPTVDRNILRLAVWEMVHTDMAPAIVIDEALELAHQFGGDESAHFVNGVLDAVRRDARPAAATPQS